MNCERMIGAAHKQRKVALAYSLGVGVIRGTSIDLCKIRSHVVVIFAQLICNRIISIMGPE